MLYTETVAGPTLELLKKLEAEVAMAKNKIKFLSPFRCPERSKHLNLSKSVA